MSISAAPESQAAQPSTVNASVNTLATTAVADAWVNQTLSAINVYRAKANLPALKLNSKISAVSQEWATHLGKQTMDPNFDWANIHRKDAGGSKIPAGASWYGEVVSFNFSAQSTVDWWMDSPSHKAALMSPKATDIGIGYVTPTTGPYAGWHQTVANVAQYKSTSTPAPTPAPVAKTGVAAINALAASDTSIGRALYNEVTGLRNGGVLRNFQNATVYWSNASGTHSVRGGIMSTWGSLGWENSRLGYPTSEEYASGAGVRQDFQGGYITWSLRGGSTVFYK